MSMFLYKQVFPSQMLRITIRVIKGCKMIRVAVSLVTLAIIVSNSKVTPPLHICLFNWLQQDNHLMVKTTSLFFQCARYYAQSLSNFPEGKVLPIYYTAKQLSTGGHTSMVPFFQVLC